jgi:large subunit ribosomal protein L23
MQELYGVIKRPVMTEKSALASEEQNRYAFEVEKSANKYRIKKAVEFSFGVKVASVNTQMVHGAVKRFARGVKKKPNWKKAIVQLRAGDKIEFFKGV